MAENPRHVYTSRNLTDITTWFDVVNLNHCSFLVDPTFKCILNDGRLLDRDYIDQRGGGDSPDNTTVVHEMPGVKNSLRYAIMVATSSLFSHFTAYLKITFD